MGYLRGSPRRDIEVYRAIGLPIRDIALAVNLEGICKAFIDNMQLADFDRWLLLNGTFGTGKTVIACEIAYRLYLLNFDVKYIKLRNLLQLFKKSYSTRLDEVAEYRACELLIIDEIGVKPMTEDEQANIEDLLSERYEQRLNCVLITNQANFTCLGDMLRSRLQHIGILHTLKNETYRKPSKFEGTEKRLTKKELAELESKKASLTGEEYLYYLRTNSDEPISLFDFIKETHK